MISAKVSESPATAESKNTGSSGRRKDETADEVTSEESLGALSLSEAPRADGNTALSADVPAKRQVAKQTKQSGVSWTLINFWLDVFLLLNLLYICFTMGVLRFVFPPGVNSQGWTLWGFGFQAWLNTHLAAMSVFLLAVSVHLMFHWTWVCGVVESHLCKWTGRRKEAWDNGVRTLAGVGLLIILFGALGAALAVAYLSIRNPMF